jgi:hypothetical protein
MSRTDDFWADKQTNRRTEPITLPLAHVRGVKKLMPAKTRHYSAKPSAQEQ